MNKKYQPRFLAYCKSNNNTPEEQFRKDELEYPGGKMCGFILWIRKKLAEYYKLDVNKENFLDKYTLTNQNGFTKFLENEN